MYSGETKPGPVYSDGTNVYWIAGTTLRSGPAGGGCKATTLIKDLGIAGKAVELLGDTDALYLSTTDPKQLVIKIDKTTNAKSVLVGTNYCAGGGNGLIAQNSTHIVFACLDANGVIERVLKTGATSADIVVKEPAPRSFTGLAADETFAYVATPGIGKQYLNGSGGQALAAQANATALALAVGDDLYWLSGGKLYTGILTTLNPELRSSQLTNPQVLVADSKGAYVGDLGAKDGEGSIVFAAAQKTGAVVMASKENHPTAIATDTGFVYWTNADGTIRRTARP